MKETISAVIVSYQSSDVIAKCLDALADIDDVVVVDNASSDGTRAVVESGFPGVRLIANEANRGFAAAVNQGVRAATGDLILLLNPDTVLKTSVQPMVDICARGVGIVGGRLVGADGQAQLGFNVRAFPTAATLAAEALLLNRIWPGNPINRRYRCLDFDLDAPGACDQPAGAFLMFSRKAFEEVEGFDEQFFPLWFEDVDFCLRVKQSGFQVVYEPAATAVHEGGHSLRRVALQSQQVAWYGSLLRFAKKHFSAAAAGRLRLAIRMGLALRWLGCALGAGNREQRQAYGKVWRMIAPQASEHNQEPDAGLRRSPRLEQRKV